MRQLTELDKNFVQFLQRFTRFDEIPEGNVQFCSRKAVNKTNHIAMNAKFKAAYEAPAMRVVDLQVKASLCIVSKQSIDWTYENDIFSPDDLKGWGLPGYGDAIDI